MNEEQLPYLVDVLDLAVQRGVPADDYVLYGILKKCIAEKDIILGTRVHALADRSGYQSNAFVANHVMRLYASHGMLEDVRRVFFKVDVPDHHMWASIIWAHARHGEPAEAIRCYRHMRNSNVRPDNYVFVAALKACAAAEDLSSCRELHADILGTAHKPNLYVGTSLVTAYAKCGSLEEARSVFDNLSSKTVVTWNAMLAGYAQCGNLQEAHALYAAMPQNTPANRVTFVCVLQACTSAGALHLGKQLHAKIDAKGLLSDVMIGSCLVDMYAKCGSLIEARRVFDRLPMRNTVTWNSMIAGYARHGHGEEALSLYARMQQDSMSPADPVTFSFLLQACASIGDLHQGAQLHAQIRQRGIESNVVLGSCLMKMYSKCGRLDDARRLFDQLPMRDEVAWTAMIAGYAQQGFGQEALALYSSMQLQGMTPGDSVIYVCLLQACASIGALHQGRQIHVQIQRKGMEGDLLVGSTLVYMYATCGSLDDAHTVFKRMPRKNVVTWNALLSGYAENSHDRMAVRCFDEMLEQGIEPDETTFICLLVACSHSGLVHEGQQFFRMMIEKYNITPGLNHCNCVVDILARAGQLDEAENVLRSMPFSNNAVGWKSLLHACKNLGDVQRGKRCFDTLVQLEPVDASAYVLLGNIYASAGRWQDVRQIEAMRKSAGAWKKPGKAGIEVRNKVHEFVVGERRCDVSSKWNGVNARLREGGHVPHTELVLKDMSRREKEDVLCGHAEKLALAYGLLHTPPGTSLLVTKNLRMCDDCHSSTKIMSSIERRKIIVRDTHRVHQFENGYCSCGDRP